MIHVNFLHALFNLLALAPLMERFEAEHGTLLTLAYFFGRTYFSRVAHVERKMGNADTAAAALSTIPGALYLLIERGILRGNTTVMGARWVGILHFPAKMARTHRV